MRVTELLFSQHYLIFIQRFKTVVVSQNKCKMKETFERLYLISIPAARVKQTTAKRQAAYLKKVRADVAFPLLRKRCS